jgi:hypothetical protein
MSKGRKVSEETIEKIKKSRKNQIMRKGFKHSMETIEKIKSKRAIQVIKSGWKMSDESKKKMSKIRQGNKYPYKKIIINDTVYIGYEAAANAFNVSTQSIYTWIKNGKEGFRIENNTIRN